MFLSFKDLNKTYWTHSSLISPENAHAIKQIQGSRDGVQNKSSFIATYVALELVNRIHLFKKMPFQNRAGIVAATFLASRMLSGAIYDSSVDKLIKQRLQGAPIWENKIEVPELDKKFFFIDDDNNFEPSLWHHGIDTIEKPKKYFLNEHQ